MQGGRWLPHIIVASTSGCRTRGLATTPGLTIACSLGRAGIGLPKREGDGQTPAGRHRLVAVLYRPDRSKRPRTRLPAIPLRPAMGWCDDPGDRRYNQPVQLPFPANHEHLWRDDHLYDLLVVLDYNLAPARRGAGSAIFLHLAPSGRSPTAGCVAVERRALLRLLARCGPDTVLTIGLPVIRGSRKGGPIQPFPMQRASRKWRCPP